MSLCRREAVRFRMGEQLVKRTKALHVEVGIKAIVRSVLTSDSPAKLPHVQVADKVGSLDAISQCAVGRLELGEPSHQSRIVVVSPEYLQSISFCPD